jgi:bacterioferritin-associated ferredoxin
MDIKSNITNRAELSLSDAKLKANGSAILVDKINAYKSQFGHNPKLWPLVKCLPNSIEINNYDVLINEFILKCRGDYKISYSHQEICHCRTVPTEAIIQSLKQGCRNLKDIHRATKAGTGCGTCVPSLEILIQEILVKD